MYKYETQSKRRTVPGWFMASLFLFLVFPLLASCDQELTLPVTANSTASMDPQEVQAVHEVMAATGNSWVSQIPDVCKERWHGIECTLDPRTNKVHVVSLSLGVLSDDTAFPACSPDAAISPAIAKLTYLKRLFFYRCCRGNPRPIPPQIGELGATLESLVLRENGHSGAVPAQLANLTKLHTLDLHGNNLSSIPEQLGGFKLMRRLDLSSNRLTGRIPSSLGGLEAIKILDMSNNGLQGEIPNTLSGLSHLKKLDLSNNKLNGSIPGSLGQLRNLLLLDLGHNELTGGIPASFGELSNLQVLVLKSTKLKSPIPGTVGNLTNLQVLMLSSSSTTGTIPKQLGQLKHLKVLHLENNSLVGSIPEEVLNLSQLTELNVAENFLSGPISFSNSFINKLGGQLRLMNNSGLCYRSHEHNERLGIERCTDLEDYRDPTQNSLPAIIIPSPPAFSFLSSSLMQSPPSIAAMVLLCMML